MRCACTLSYYTIKRLLRQRWLVGTLIALPLVGMLVRITLGGPAWVCPIVCAALTAAVVGAQYMMDKASGLEDGFRACPLPYWQACTGRALAGTSLFALQMGIFIGLSLCW